MQKKTGYIKVTPALAHKWLATNHDNRPIREHLVKSFAVDMENGDWDDNGETIKFDESGELIDGQHRLLAIIESNKTVTLLVVWGVKRRAQDTVDTGAKRTFSDVLSLRGEKNAPVLGAIVRKVCMWEDGMTLGKKVILSNNILFKTLDKYPWLRDVATQASNLAAGSGMMASVAGYCWWAFWQISPEDCKGFFERLNDNANSVKGNPIDSLKRKLNDISKNDHERKSDIWMAAVTIKAWNKFRDGTNWEVVDFRPGGVNPEKLPVPH